LHFPNSSLLNVLIVVYDQMHNMYSYQNNNAGLVVDHRPEVGAVFQTSAGYYGHVGIVERVNN
jgi:surface antigen